MTYARALLFADWRAFVNDARRAVRSPSRIFIWLCFAVGGVSFVVSRAFARGGAGGAGGPGSDVARADYLVCGVLSTLALTLASGAGQLGFFRSRAEALFITGSSVPAPVAIAYLQARESLGASVRVVWSAIFFGFVVAPRHLSPFAAVADVVLFVAIVAARNAIALPRRFAPPAVRVACAIAGGVLALLILEAPVRDVLRALPLPAGAAHVVRHVLPAWHPGRVLFAPNLLWLAAAVAIAAAGIADLTRYGRDAYPDLYALSLARIDAVAFRAERRRRTDAKRRETPPVDVRLPAPPGPAVFVWKSIVEFRRQHTVTLSIGGAATWVVVGAAVARIAAALGPPAFSMCAAGAAFLTFFATGVASHALTADLRRPLFWLSGSPLVARVGALVAARMWRSVLRFALVAAGLAAGGGPPFAVIGTALIFPALATLFTSAGVALYALSPTAAASAPGLRFVAVGVLLVPVVAAGIFGSAAGFVFDTLLVGALLLAESAALVTFVTWRIDGRVDRLVA